MLPYFSLLLTNNENSKSVLCSVMVMENLVQGDLTSDPEFSEVPTKLNSIPPDLG